LVCGKPLCDDHECNNVAAGMTGSHGVKHSEKGHEQWLEWRKKNKKKPPSGMCCPSCGGVDAHEPGCHYGRGQG
jgi:hypothetical protein